MLDFEKPLYWLMGAVVLLFLVTALGTDGAAGSVKGFLALQQHPARLINDFTAVGGTGGALLNAAVMLILSLVIIRVNGVRLSGPTIAAVLTIAGFSLFGKTPVNALPVVAGVYMAAKLVGKSFSSYILIGLFGTALGPMVTFLVYETGLSGVPAILAGAAGGVAAGLILPALAVVILRMHEGYNIYNIGFTAGFLGLFAAAFLAAAGRDIGIRVIWNDSPGLELVLLVPVLSVLFVIWGLAIDGKKVFLNLGTLLKQTGRLPSDFVEIASPGSAPVNAGLLGLAGSIYLLAIGADLNGPVIGGLLTVIGFATFGKHLKNCWPVALGVIAGTLIFGKSLTAPGPVLALLFGTTLAPLAGHFGPLIGFAAGFTHLAVVERTAAWHGGMDLYNNGFAGGLTATLFVAVIEWVNTNRKNRST